ITAQLIDAASETQIWADKYTGTLDDIFDLQERVSHEIARALDLKLSAAEQRTMADRPITDAAAYDCWLRARHELANQSAGSLDRARALLKRGLEIAPSNSRLRAALVYEEVFRLRLQGRFDAAALDAATAQANEILRTDPACGTAHYVLGTAA